MGNHLRLQFIDDRDGTGLLRAVAEADGFSEPSEASFDVGSLEEFARAINIFPFPSEDHRRSISSGFGCTKDGELAQEHLGISVYLADARRGYPGIPVRMATPVWPDTRPDSKKQAVVEILATYEPLSRFSKQLLLVLGGWLKEAVIEGESLPSKWSWQKNNCARPQPGILSAYESPER